MHMCCVAAQWISKSEYDEARLSCTGSGEPKHGLCVATCANVVQTLSDVPGFVWVCHADRPLACKVLHAGRVVVLIKSPCATQLLRRGQSLRSRRATGILLGVRRVSQGGRPSGLRVRAGLVMSRMHCNVV